MASFHPRNRHQGRYDFARLIAASPALEPWLLTTPRGEPSIDFANPAAVKALNGALLADQYGLTGWELPEGYLCPPVPGRADYVHAMADVLATSNDGRIPTGDGVRALDIGVGASGIYPIIGRGEYGWRFIGSDIDPTALASSQRNIDRLPAMRAGIQLRRQHDAQAILDGILADGDELDAVLCNPPFHLSPDQAREGTERKWRKLGRDPAERLNFGGQGGELWCPGGERGFAERLIRESAQRPEQVLWYSILISKEAHLPDLYRSIHGAGAWEWRTIRMEQGQKVSRFVTWTYLDGEQQRRWARRRFSTGNHLPPSAPAKSRDPLHGKTLEMILTELVAHHGWSALGESVPINCFRIDPSVASSLKFLRRTPWARQKVEALYLEHLRRLTRRG